MMMRPNKTNQIPMRIITQPRHSQPVVQTVPNHQRKVSQQEKVQSPQKQNEKKPINIPQMRQRLDNLLEKTQFVINKQPLIHKTPTLTLNNGKPVHNPHVSQMQRPVSIQPQHLVNNQPPNRTMHSPQHKFFHQTTPEQFIKPKQIEVEITSQESKNMTSSQNQKQISLKSTKSDETPQQEKISSGLPLTPTKNSQNHQPEKVNPEIHEIKQPKRKIKQEELSWTKYIALELKNEELMKILENNEKILFQKMEESKKQLEQKDQTIKHLAKKFNDYKQDNTEQITKMKQQFSEKIEEKNAHIKKLVEDLTGLTLKEKDQIFKKKIKQILDENQKIKFSNAEKDKEKFELESALRLKQEDINEYKSRQSLLRKSIAFLQTQKQRLENSGKGQEFETTLKVQLEDIHQLKQQIQLLQDENNRLRESLRSAQHRTESAFNEIKINQVKEGSLRNRIATEMGIKLNEKDNKIKSLENKLMTMEDKYRSATKQIRSKDEFLKQHLVGRTDELEIKKYIEGILDRYVNRFESESEGAVQELRVQVRQLSEKLRYYESW